MTGSTEGSRLRIVGVVLLWILSVLELLGMGVAGLSLIPSYSMLVALEASIDPTAVPALAQASASLYLAMWVWIGWRWTLREFVGSIVTEGR